MNFFNLFGGRGRGDNDCCCTIIWLMFLLSICGNGCGGYGHDNDCFGLIILLLLLSNCGCGDMGGCRG